MQTSLHGGRKGSPPPSISDYNQEEDNCSKGDSEGEDHSYLPHEVFALTWHADVGNIMHMVPCIVSDHGFRQNPQGSNTGVRAKISSLPIHALAR